MKRLRLLTTQLSSKSLRLLANELSARLGYKVWRSKFPKLNRIHLLYGNGKNKLQQYQWFDANQVPALPFTTSIEIGREWLKSGKIVVARKFLKASEGKGITICQNEDSIVDAPLYTCYIPKKREYRVHIFDNQVVSVLEKRRKSGLPPSKIRNTANGYVFCRENVQEPEGIRELALKAGKVTDSHFKGVDIGYNEKYNKLFVIEVNSAPGMEGTTVQEYANIIQQELQNA